MRFGEFTMETRIDFLNWLSKKLYQTSIGLYATVGLIMILPSMFVKMFGLAQFVASFVAFFIVIFLRAVYESLIIYEAPIKSLSLPKILILTLVTSVTLSLISYYLKPTLGYFSIPIAVIIAFMVVGKLKAALWPLHERPGFFAELPAKLDINKWGTYGFYAFLVGITYMAYAKYGFNFYCAFAAAYFIGMIFEESYNLIKLYEQKLIAKNVVFIILWSACCAIASSAIVWLMMSNLGYLGQAATITSVILLKLIQPLGLRKFILKF
jgi:hypothetical protein